VSPMDRSLSQILQAIEAVELEAVGEDFDPAVLVGELRDKVDATHRYLQWLDFYAEAREAEAARLSEAAEKARARADRLREYVLTQMKDRQYERLPGEAVSIVRRRSSNPAVELKRPPEPADALTLGPLVRVVPRSYAWNKKEIGKLAKAGKLPDGLAGLVTLTYSERVEFEDRALLDKKDAAK
jgi:hypothetical protein